MSQSLPPTPLTPLARAGRRLTPALVDLIQSLAEGDRIALTQTVRVGSRKWTTTARGTFRGVSFLATGVTTDRIPEDDLIIPTVHFTKDNGEMTSLALDEHTDIRKE